MGCSDGSTRSIETCKGVAVSGLARTWETPDANFDDFGSSLYAMFQVTTLAEWVPILYSGVDAPEDIGQASREEASRPAVLFFAGYIVVQLWFVVPLFLASIVDTFTDV